jgi:hypothetical protein
MAAGRKARKLAKKVATPRPALVPQPGGRGALLSGGVPGHKGAGGRPPNALREEMRGDLGTVLQKLRARYERGELDDLDYANFLAKYGVGTTQTQTDTKGNDVERALRERHARLMGAA